MTPTDSANRTPPFLAWAIPQTCQLRERSASHEPLAVERHLRPVRCWSIGVHQRQLIGDICVGTLTQTDSPQTAVVGFPIRETLRRYGGEKEIVAACSACPANIKTDRQLHSVAGCFGWLALDRVTTESLTRIWAAVTAAPDLLAACRTHFPRTSPPWYGLLLVSHLRGAPLQTLHQVLSQRPAQAASPDRPFRQHDLQRVDEPSTDSLERLAAALSAAVKYDLEIRCELLPGGSRTGRTWTVDAHCDRCRASRDPASRRCIVCGKTGGVAPPSIRRARGIRPFMPLEVFLGHRRAAELRAQIAAREK